MLKPNYISSSDSKIISLAEKSWEIFRNHLSIYQYAMENPSASPRKTEIAHAIINRGKPGCCTFYREGVEYKLRPLHLWAFEKAVNQNCKIYYVSFGKIVLLYFDVDLHYAWQKNSDGQDAKERLDAMFQKFFGDSVLYWFPSARGFNGYMKVNLEGRKNSWANEIFDRLEQALKLFLASCGNLADFEVKGKIGYMQEGQYKWAYYGKLPIHHPSWNFQKLEQFENTPEVSIYKVLSLCKTLETNVPQEVLVQHQQHKISLGDKPIFEGDWFLVTPAINKAMTEKYGEEWRFLFNMLKGDEEDTWLHKRYYRPDRIPVTEKEIREADPCISQHELPKNHQKPVSLVKKKKDTLQEKLEAIFDHIDSHDEEDNPYGDILGKIFARIESGEDQEEEIPTKKSIKAIPEPPQKAHREPAKVNLDCTDLLAEANSLTRQREGLLRYARYLKRVPEVDEALKFIREKKLYSGIWEENENKREIRVRSILQFIATTFDPAKCANGHVNIGKFDAWAKMKFPQGLIGGKKRYMDEEGNIVEGCQGIKVSSRFIAVFMAIAEFCLLIDKNQDSSLPHDRSKGIWNSLKAKGLIAVSFNDRFWAVCRDEVEKYGIIAITDRDYGPGKAMRWEIGTYFPGLGLWKTQKQPSLQEKVDFEEEGKERIRDEHNTFLHLQAGENAISCGLSRSRPPPLDLGMG